MKGKGRDIRPLGVTILGYLYVLGAFGLLFGAAILFFGILDESLMLEYLPEIDPIINILIGAMVIGGLSLFGIALLFLNGFKIGYYIVLVLQVLSLIDDLLWSQTGGLGSILISLIIIYYLLRPHVKYWFGV